MAQIFAYIVHKDGVADDTALELVAAAKKLDASVDLIAVVTRSGAELDTVCSDVAASYNEVYKIDNKALAYPNAEVVRKELVNVLPVDGIVLVPHTTFGMDLGPGLSFKMDSAFVADAVDFEGVEGSTLKLVRQELGIKLLNERGYTLFMWFNRRVDRGQVLSRLLLLSN